MRTISDLLNSKVVNRRGLHVQSSIAELLKAATWQVREELRKITQKFLRTAEKSNQRMAAI